jgi:hypothetical protein
MRKDRIRHDVRAKLIRCQALPSLFRCGAAFARRFQSPMFNPVVRDSIVHDGRPIARIKVKPVACQHWAPSTFLGPHFYATATNSTGRVQIKRCGPLNDRIAPFEMPILFASVHTGLPVSTSQVSGKHSRLNVGLRPRRVSENPHRCYPHLSGATLSG